MDNVFKLKISNDGNFNEMNCESISFIANYFLFWESSNYNQFIPFAIHLAVVREY